MVITDYDNDFFRILAQIRPFPPCANWNKHNKETMYLGILWLTEMTTLTAKEMCEMFGIKYDKSIAARANQFINRSEYHEFQFQMYDRMHQRKRT